MTEAAHGLRECGDLRGEGEVVRRQAGEQGFHGRLVFGDQGAFHLAFLGPPEGIEGRAAQGLQGREQAEGGEHPGAEFAFLQVAGAGVLGAAQGRGQVDGQFFVALKRLAQGPAEFGRGIEPRDLVLVLVGQQLEERSGGGFG